MSTEENKTIARRYFEESDQDLSVLDELMAEDVIVYFPGLPEPIRGREAFKQVLRAYQTAFPDLDSTVEDMVAEGDKVAFRWNARATHTGDFQGIPPTGKQVQITGINIARIVGGKVVEDRGEFDSLGLLQQLGVVPPPGQGGG